MQEDFLAILEIYFFEKKFSIITMKTSSTYNQEMSLWLTEAMDSANVSGRQMAKAWGVDPTMVTKSRNGVRGIKAREVAIAEKLTGKKSPLLSLGEEKSTRFYVREGERSNDILNSYIDLLLETKILKKKAKPQEVNDLRFYLQSVIEADNRAAKLRSPDDYAAVGGVFIETARKVKEMGGGS